MNNWTSLALIIAVGLHVEAVHGADPGCEESATYSALACGYAVKSGWFEQRALCFDTPGAADACLDDADDERTEAYAACVDQLGARLELCTALESVPHEPAFGPAYAANFVDPMTIGSGVPANPYLPLVQGNVWVYEATIEDDGELVTERTTVTVTEKLKYIDGIWCLVVNDVVEIDGLLVEDTDDWLAQDVDGNIWYCGEESKDYEFTEGDDPFVAELIEIDGSFKAGVDGAKPGILLPGTPIVGDVFRQEVHVGEAEDAIEILDLAGTETVPVASCTGTCLVTRDFTPLEPETEEQKFYEPGIGRILEIDLEDGERNELIDFTVN